MSDPAAVSTPPEWHEFSPEQNRLLSILYGAGEPVYAILDAAQDDRIPAFLEGFGAEYTCLYEGKAADDLKSAAPYLTLLPQHSKMFIPILKEGWAKNWGYFFNSRASLPQIRYHLRHFLMVQLEDGVWRYFRFYDPRVLQPFLASSLPNELASFFGPISRFIIPGPDAGQAVAYRYGAEGLLTETINFANKAAL